MAPVPVFISAAAEDQPHVLALKKHLTGLVRTEGTTLWHRDDTRPGVDWKRERDAHLDEARIFLLLVSVDYLASAPCQEEMACALARQRDGRAHVTAILVRACDWALSLTGADVTVLPPDHRPVTSHPNPDEAWALVAKAIHAAMAGRPQLAAAPFLLPFLRNPDFVGRDDDLDNLHGLLQKGEAVGVRPAALTGMGGIGKTQLAVEYAYRYRNAYPGGVYWVNASQSFQAELARLAERVGLREDDAPESERQKRLARAFAAYLAEHQGALVIFDNVDDPLALRDPRADIVPAQLRCRLLFTTRRRDPGSPFATLDVRVLPVDVALRLLLGSEARRGLLSSGPPDESEAATAICRTLGCLPLAIVLGAAYLGKYPRISFSGYLNRLRKEGALATIDAAWVDPRKLATQHDAAVEATLRTQWEALENAQARQVLKTAALLGEAARVPRATLSLLTGLLDEAEEGHAAPLEEALHELSALSLVEELTEKAIRLHPLVRAFADTQMAARDAFAAACSARLDEALWDMGRLHREVASRGIDAVLGYLRLGAALAGADRQERCEQMIRPLDREAHGLRGWEPAKQPGFFLQQLRNQCFEMELEEVQRRAEAKLDERRWPYLRERFRTSRASEALVRTLEGHTNVVNGVAITPDGRLAVSASADGTLKVWNLATGHEVHTLHGHTGAVSGVAITPDGRLAISASEDHTLKFWDLLIGHEVQTLHGHIGGVSGVAITLDGRHAVSASWDGTLKVWDLLTGHEDKTFQGHTREVNGVAITPDGRHAVSASWDDTLKVWDLLTGHEVQTLQGHIHGLNGVAITPDGRLAVSVSWDHTLKVWNLLTGHEVQTLQGHTHGVNGVVITPDGRLAVSASWDDTLKVWDLLTGHEVRSLQGHIRGVNGVAITPDGRLAISASRDYTLKVWDLLTGHEITTLQGHTHGVSDVAITPDGRLAISASDDRTLKVWDLATSHEVQTLQGHTHGVNGVAITPDGRLAISASKDHTLKVWDLLTGHEIKTLHGHTYRVRGVAVTPDSRLVISASRDHTLKVWDLATGHEVKTLQGHTSIVNGVAITPDSRLAISASSDRTLKVWNLATGTAFRTLQGHTDGVNGVAVTPDGRYAVSASEDHTLKVWDLLTGHEVKTLQGHTEEVDGVAVTPDGRHAVSASWDHTLKIWNLTTYETVATLKTHAPVFCCAITPDGKTLLAGDQAGAIHIVDWLHAASLPRR
jgi:WD40 repeat protein